MTVNISETDFWVAPLDERAAVFAEIRNQDGLAFFPEPDLEYLGLEPGPGYYAVTRHADILEASHRPDRFCSGQGATGIADMPPDFREFFGSMINLDDPRHARLRRIVSRGFTPRILRKLEDDVVRIAGEVVDRIADRGECDFVTEVAARLPLQIICDMMGIPESDRQFVFERSNVILGAGDPEYTPEGADIVTALLTAGGELAAMVGELAAERRQRPTDDVTSALVNAELEGERLTDQELGSFFILLVVAGNETTRNAISHGLKLLTDHPEQRAIWAADVEGVAPTAVDEIVRMASPVIFMRRTATQDAVLGGQEVREGDKLILFYWAANRDERVFDRPEVFDVRRNPNPHIGFGGPGPHFCLGAHLARREITVMYRELFSRLPDIEATAEPARLQSAFINGIKHLPVAFTPRSPVAAR